MRASAIFSGRRFFFSALVAMSSLAALVTGSCLGVVHAPASLSRGATLPAPPTAKARGPLKAGVALVDITPAPGLSLLGHGPEGRVSKGTMLRLRCQAFVLTQELGDASGNRDEAIAFVPCDLSWPSLLLQRRVAKKLVAMDVPIGPERLILSATHTHASPAHYLGAANFSGLLSTQNPGYSEDVVEFLAHRIAMGVKTAFDKRESACVGWRKASFRDDPKDLERLKGNDRGTWALHSLFAKNRSMDAFSRNALDDEEKHLFIDPVTREPDREAVHSIGRPTLWAVDGTISVLRIDGCPAERDASGHPIGPTHPLGAFSVIGVHPTAISNLNELYHGDIFGFAAREAEMRIRETTKAGPIVGIANGVEGDVSPIVDYQGPREARRLGGILAAEIVELWNDAVDLDGSGTLRSAYREVVMNGARVEAHNAFYDPLRARYPFPGEAPHKRATTCGEATDDERALLGPCDPALCPLAKLGMAAAGGAKDGRTFFLDIPEMREGSIAPLSTTCHAPKLEFDPPIPPQLAFPHRVPLHVVSVGGELVTTFPGEVTTLAGHRARRQLETYLAGVSGPGAAEALHASQAQVVQLGLTGEYLQYMATSDEYDAQQYEGASTLYGPHEARFISNQQVCLARWLYEGTLSPEDDHLCTLDHTIDGLPGRYFQPLVDQVADVSFEPGKARGGKASVFCCAPDRDCARDPAQCFEGCDVADMPARTSKIAVAGCNHHIYHLTRDGEPGYGVRWIPPQGCKGAEYQPRVRVLDAKTGEELASDEGDGVELRWADGEWRIAWFPNEREWTRAKDRSFTFEISAHPGGRGDRSLPAGEGCWRWP